MWISCVGLFIFIDPIGKIFTQKMFNICLFISSMWMFYQMCNFRDRIRNSEVSKFVFCNILKWIIFGNYTVIFTCTNFVSSGKVIYLYFFSIDSRFIYFNQSLYCPSSNPVSSSDHSRTVCNSCRWSTFMNWCRLLKCRQTPKIDWGSILVCRWIW